MTMIAHGGTRAAHDSNSLHRWLLARPWPIRVCCFHGGLGSGGHLYGFLSMLCASAKRNHRRNHDPLPKWLGWADTAIALTR